ncbi:hypothetical protein EDC56_3718 [Sinobacterium caligoides]|uniref:Uncharacterized protein n=1 Tax=Sinobacterium caligoides TaxID=933926 RepID=A0A3N2D522_9GAMM|nr:hypothetical protein [Sinobacterium caligoides]ROR94905.1 hypothetical protein EDC56_3718 [Sinobacterium caligoides]
MQAAYRISIYSEELLVSVIPILLVLVTMPSADYEHMKSNIAGPLLEAISKSMHLYKSTIYQDLGALAEHFGISENSNKAILHQSIYQPTASARPNRS